MGYTEKIENFDGYCIVCDDGKTLARVGRLLCSYECWEEFKFDAFPEEIQELKEKEETLQ